MGTLCVHLLILFYADSFETSQVFWSWFEDVHAVYTPGIYADGYIVFVFPFVRSSVCMFVCSFVRTSVTFVEFKSKFCVKVSQVVYISATTYQKAFIFGP